MTKLRIFKLEREGRTPYDCFISALVYAETEEEARHTHPRTTSNPPQDEADWNRPGIKWSEDENRWVFSITEPIRFEDSPEPATFLNQEWTTPDQVKATLLGESFEFLNAKPSVIQGCYLHG
jgi:hypothetical protein